MYGNPGGPCCSLLRQAGRRGWIRGDHNPGRAWDTGEAAPNSAGVHRRRRGAMRVLPERRDSDCQGRVGCESDRYGPGHPQCVGRRAVPLLRACKNAARHQEICRCEADMNCSRRDFLKGAGALVVSFRAASAFGAQTGGGQFSTHASHINADSLDAWLAIDAGGSVTAFTGKCDFGQGIYTAQTQLVAEELCVPLERVKLVQCDTAVTPDQGSTSGSQSTPTNFNHQNLALAAATAREALLQLASENLGEPVDHLKAENGVVTGISGRRVSYGDLIGGKHFSLTLNPAAQRRPQAEWTVLGKPVPSLDLTSLMTGQFEFVHYVSVPGMLHGRVVRPPAIGASLLSVDQASVKDVPGLVKVVVRKNFVGVVAETQYGAVQAAR